MARVLVVFGTSEGQTATIAERIADVLESEDHYTTLVHGRHVSEEFRLRDYDAVIVGASIHMGKHQRYLTRFVREHAAELNELPSAFFSVSLTAAAGTDESQATAQGLVDEFLATTGWHPDETMTVPGALTYSRYGWIKRFVMKQIARQEGGGTDTTRDYEYTDWDEISSFAIRFARSLE
ncbi:menaquinone-dependent protoporphyrinogen IX dehydrogenase [Haladaptatus caseinilyticus]|uniref:menaquinone-dependent protoporphyrinogen IX dehydrogenase n=1 Tax=Haladaptatus caseinilyticus TaxID=2993314 RepID=UPI00224A6368|nr:menaquinone-dependent protoporphyrinogen IX dehydrogenase [Haladaptatus caseinilyticus]